ncbi:MAG: hypothetical protein ACJAS6_000926 [Rickettsiales bacterium]|jgi:hypothetical protein
MTESQINKEKELSLWFENYQKPQDSIEVRSHILSDNKYLELEEFLVQAIPDCYISKEKCASIANTTNLSASEIIKNKLPDKGNVMSGDFGEIVTLFYLGSERSENLKKIKKWRYKQDRQKAAPLSDVIILHRKSSTHPSDEDFVICAESKMKATKSKKYRPIESSIDGYFSDKTRRLAQTLVWLKEKAIDDGNPDSIEFIKRFTDGHLDSGYKKLYRAVAIIDRNLLDEELLQPLNLPPQNDEFEVVVIGIKDLKNLYERSFTRSIEEVVHE